jgi:hypothetical protein
LLLETHFSTKVRPPDLQKRCLPVSNNITGAYDVKRRWDDDVVFKNQARGTEDKRGKEFVNDLLRSDFHRRFMGKYVR